MQRFGKLILSIVIFIIGVGGAIMSGIGLAHSFGGFSHIFESITNIAKDTIHGKWHHIGWGKITAIVSLAFFIPTLIWFIISLFRPSLLTFILFLVFTSITTGLGLISIVNLYDGSWKLALKDAKLLALSHLPHH